MSLTLDDFDFDLPDHLIATRPAVPRSAARLLVSDGGVLHDAHVHDLGRFLQRGDLLVLNNTRVLPARLKGQRHRISAQGEVVAGVEIMLAGPAPGGLWLAMAKPARKVALGETVRFSGGLEAEIRAKDEGGFVTLAFNREGAALESALAEAGEIPLPPYIATRRAVDSRDITDYQTVFARTPGAVAAPTASLHFDADLLASLAAQGIETVEVTLHVGAGTFLPVKTDRIEDHRMHAEWGEVSPEAARRITDAKQAGRRVIPVGTTALRLIESAATAPGIVSPFRGDTDIFIRPGFTFQATDGLMTNFHLPKSTLLMLVSALIGVAPMRAAYAHAIAENYRFYSYGDSSLLFP